MITGHGTVGIRLTDPADNPVTVVGAASIIPHDSYGISAAAWTITTRITAIGRWPVW